MPYKVWSVNEILTASDMNTYVGNQTVLSFAGTAARASALAAPVEGMVAYLEDTDRLEVYKGTAVGWVATVFPGGTPVANHLLQYDGTDWQSVSQSEAGAIAVFAGTAARGSAIPSPTEGMVTYRSDDDVVEVFDGSAFVPVGSDPGLVAVKHVLKTNTFVGAGVGAGANVAVTNLSISHTLANASNKLIVSAYFGVAASSSGDGRVGIAVADNGTLIGVGTSVSNRVPVGAGGNTFPTGSTFSATMPSVNFVYEPGDTASHTYTVRAINIVASSHTLYVNRTQDDTDNGNFPRGTSALVIQEVAV